jgi:hypothetical protein
VFAGTGLAFVTRQAETGELFDINDSRVSASGENLAMKSGTKLKLRNFPSDL